ncbi:hypothetical protein GCM10022631_35000 [Deinococcus rubellus]
MGGNRLSPCRGLWIGMNTALSSQVEAVKRAEDGGPLQEINAAALPVVQGRTQASRDQERGLSVAQEQLTALAGIGGHLQITFCAQPRQRAAFHLCSAQAKTLRAAATQAF